MIQIRKNDIKKKRTLKIFVNAAAQIIDENGIEAVTIRKVAKIAGYNSATIYNYFDNRNQLIFFAAIKFISDYVQALPDYVDQSDDTLERFLLNWECFCKYSFRKPQIYYSIFTADIGERPEDLMKVYFSLFFFLFGHPSEDLIPMLLETDLSKRAAIALEPCIREGYFSEEEASQIDEMLILIYHGMMTLLINNRVDYSVEEAVETTMRYIRRTVESALD